MTLKEVLVCGSLATAFVALLGASPGKTDLTPTEQMAKVAQAVLLYVEDNAGRFPFASSHGPTSAVRAVAMISVPAGWTSSVSPERAGYDALACANSTLPYADDKSVLAISGAPEERVSRWSYENPMKEPIATSFTFNGFLNLYPQAQIEAPSFVPVMWTGIGRVRRLGYASASPVLVCSNRSYPAPCVFDPREQGQNGTTSQAEGDANAFADGMYFAYADGSVKRIEPNGNASNRWTFDPFATYGPGNVPKEGWGDGRYSILFRPDRTE